MFVVFCPPLIVIINTNTTHYNTTLLPADLTCRLSCLFIENMSTGCVKMVASLSSSTILRRLDGSFGGFWLGFFRVLLRCVWCVCGGGGKRRKQRAGISKTGPSRAAPRARATGTQTQHKHTTNTTHLQVVLADVRPDRLDDLRARHALDAQERLQLGRQHRAQARAAPAFCCVFVCAFGAVAFERGRGREREMCVCM